ncbi:MAG: hypothetical protein J5742_00425 [Alphaproteobacteria bacterium]|nr:hypothetical protein [Alphaproteobacteria bacterium]
MNEDEKMFHIGIIMLVVMSVMTVALQVCYRVQNSARRNVHQKIVQTQKDFAVAQANFSSYVRPEILRNLVTSTTPKAEVISFHKSVEIQELPDRMENR